MPKTLISKKSIRWRDLSHFALFFRLSINLLQSCTHSALCAQNEQLASLWLALGFELVVVHKLIARWSCNSSLWYVEKSTRNSKGREDTEGREDVTILKTLQ